jgi:hypothetical protein
MRAHPIKRSREAAVAEKIVSVLGFTALRAYSEWGDAIRYTVRGSGLKLRSIILSRESLNRLLRDPKRAVKVEYLRRELLRRAVHAVEYRYPRPRVRPCLSAA